MWDQLKMTLLFHISVSYDFNMLQTFMHILKWPWMLMHVLPLHEISAIVSDFIDINVSLDLFLAAEGLVKSEN